MKIFIGKSSSVWMVSPKTGSVKKLPVSMIGLFGWMAASIILGAASVSFFMMHTVTPPDETMQTVRQALFGSELGKRSRDLESTIARLQKKSEEAKRLTARVEGRLQNLEGILGKVTEDPRTDQKSKSVKLLKPASFMSAQRRTLKQLDRMAADLRMLPLQPPVKNGILTSHFGPRSSVGGEAAHFHSGVDISFRGTSNTVYAAGAGVVKQVGVMNGYGLYVDLQHARGVVTRYAHLEAAQVRDGQKVRAGQVIALGGSSGRATGAHLHYEVQVRGRARDPELFLALPKKLEMVLEKQTDLHRG